MATRQIVIDIPEKVLLAEKLMRSALPMSYTPSEWLALDLGTGELAAMALALENPDHTILLDDALARRTSQAAGLEIWGTLRVLLETKNQGLTRNTTLYSK